MNATGHIRRGMSAVLVTAMAVVAAWGVPSPASAGSPSAAVATATGQNLSIAITAPAGDVIPAGEAVTVSGTAGVSDIAAATTPLNAIFVVDASGSTTEMAGMDCDGSGAVSDGDDYNGDGRVGDIMDCELHGVAALNDSLVPRPHTEVGIVVFADRAAAADLGPEDGDQPLTTPDAQYVISEATTPRPALPHVIGGIVHNLPGAFGLNAAILYFTQKPNLGSATVYNAALTQVEAVTAATPDGEIDVVYFLSDGIPSDQMVSVAAGDTPLNRMAADGVRIQTFSVGSLPSSPRCAATSVLLAIAQRTGGTCTEVLNPAQLAASITEPVTLQGVTVAVDGGTATPVTVDPDSGEWSAPLGTLSVGTHTITATATASDGTVATAERTVLQIAAPQVDAGGPYVVDEGSSVALDATVASASAPEDLTYAWSPAGGLSAPDVEDPSYTPAQDGTDTLTLTVTDEHALTGSDTATVDVRNVAPVITAVQSDAVVPVGTPATATASFTDPGVLDTHTATWDWGDGTAPTTSAADGSAADGSAAGTHTYGSVGTYTVTVTVTDDAGDAGQAATTQVRVTAAPLVTIAGPSAPQAIGTDVTVTGTAAGQGAGLAGATIAWGDGAGGPVTVSPAGVYTATHRYAAPGIYTVRVVATDADGATAQATHEYVVVYDPQGGFVTGGGTIDSPAGAYVPDPAIAGKATFGFVSRYRKGQSVPEGDTQFQLHAANLSFVSTAYEWLVVAGSRAQYKGSGTVNGVAGHGFLVSAVDGSPDRLRVKIWNRSTGAVVYDNQGGAADDAAPQAAIGGGSIVIHTAKR